MDKLVLVPELLGTKNKKFTHEPLLKLSYTDCQTSCWRGDTLCNGELAVAAIRCEVLLRATIRATKKIAREFMLHRAILHQLVSQRHCKASC